MTKPEFTSAPQILLGRLENFCWPVKRAPPGSPAPQVDVVRTTYFTREGTKWRRFEGWQQCLYSDSKTAALGGGTIIESSLVSQGLYREALDIESSDYEAEGVRLKKIAD